ncbi:chitinase [Mucilaginibacter mallensis]|uniref:chitinase n=1 Tax=Mucilaginibacter mallensis TaxID=652787 RepID=A0A1H1XGC0_MUCMA|nr:glycoside hydrolase family 18 protein [Mucilaginibacter mallensis]SDT08171.1 chitinase [Mucilaginibacter mallensis]
MKLNFKLINNEVYTAVLLCLSLIIGFNLSANAQRKKYVVIGYVGGYRGLIDTTMVDPKKLTVINYAFVNVLNNRATLSKLNTDTINLKYLAGLKKRNRDLKIVISIGGWTWSGNFSDAVLTDTARQAFAASAVDIVRKYQLDGVDIDWEYPAQKGLGNINRPDDKHNYTLMFQAIRQDLDQLEQQTGRKMILSTAVGGFKGFITHTEMDQVQKYVTYINLMTYDYAQDSLGVAIHHTGLYGSKKYNATEYSAKAVTDFIAAGVPPGKLVIGIAFYGHGFETADTVQNGLGSKVVKSMRGGGYTFIKDSLITNKAFKYYRDEDAKAPYLFNATTKQFVTFDDEWSVKNKCQYVKDNGMAGVMFWEYSSDKKEYLLKEINHDLK